MEMRWRALSLAADLDRIQRSSGGEEVLRGDVRVGQLREALGLLLKDEGGRAEKLQMILSARSGVEK
jgi:hypothetical protein